MCEHCRLMQSPPPSAGLHFSMVQRSVGRATKNGLRTPIPAVIEAMHLLERSLGLLDEGAISTTDLVVEVKKLYSAHKWLGEYVAENPEAWPRWGAGLSYGPMQRIEYLTLGHLRVAQGEMRWV